MAQQQQQQHFLVVSYPLQGHINPGRQLAKRLAGTTGARVTFSTAVSGHRRLFPCLSSPNEEVDDGLINYIPYSDGYDDGFKGTLDDIKDFMANAEANAAKSLTTLLHRLRAAGRSVTCVIFSLVLSFAADVAHGFGIPSALYWIQPATVFAIYYHFFHGYENLIASHANDPNFTVDLPALLPFPIRDLPSFLTITSDDDPFSFELGAFRELFETLDREAARGRRARVLVNSYDALEPDCLSAVKNLDVKTIGPVLPPSFIDGRKDGGNPAADLVKADEKKYMEWLDAQPEGSVVYVSFGSILTLNKEQMAEMARGLAESQRPYLWVVRKDNGVVEGMEEEVEGKKGMVVGWCSQVRVLSHKAVGCFVTHCGWNSVLESLVSGVPMVALPQWTDQATNARLVEKAWGAGVRAADDSLEAAEMRRCIDLVMGDGERGKEIRRRAAMWSRRAREAVGEGGSSERNLTAFVEEMMTTE